mmetsp:Transcript_12704/g.27606  ORF Transcript_12704/g.27606 Transcript_12704/m.27606 type:complete len:182 (-) Transcript_12704:834-1379(-)
MNLRSNKKRSAEDQEIAPAVMAKRGTAVRPAPGQRAACVRCHRRHLACSSIYDGGVICTQCLDDNTACIHRFSRMGQQPHKREGVKSFFTTLQKSGVVEQAAGHFWGRLLAHPFNSEFGLSVSGDSAYGNAMELNVCADKMLRNEFSFNVPGSIDVNGHGTVCRYRYGDGSGSSTIGTTPS